MVLQKRKYISDADDVVKTHYTNVITNVQVVDFQMLNEENTLGLNGIHKMQEIVLILSSLAGVATAAAVRKMPRDKNQLLSLGASSHIKSQIISLKIEKDILTKTISRLYQADTEFQKIQKDKLLLKYQHQLGIVLAKLEKLDQASKHPDLGPVGDGLITLMDQKLSKMNDRLYELSSKLTLTKEQSPNQSQTTQQEKPKDSFKNTFNFEKPRQSQTESTVTPSTESIVTPSTKQRQSFELTTLTNVSKTKPKFPILDKEIRIEPQTVLENKPEISKVENKPDIAKEVERITKHRALPEPKLDPKTTTLDDDFDEDVDEIDKIKGDIIKVLSKLDQAEVE